MDFIELEPMQEEKDAYKPLRQETKGTTYIYKLYGEVGVPEDYLEVVDVLEKAEKGDTFIIDLFSDGGYVDGYFAIAHALIRTKATTVARIQKAASAAAMIALTCDKIETNLFSVMMAHAYSGGNSGKRNELKIKQEFDDRFYTFVVQNIYSTFFTEDEIERIEGGEDKWLDVHDIQERLKNWVPMRKRGKL